MMVLISSKGNNVISSTGERNRIVTMNLPLQVYNLYSAYLTLRGNTIPFVKEIIYQCMISIQTYVQIQYQINEDKV